MKVKFNKRKLVIVNFSNLTPGEIFKYQNSDIVYMKITPEGHGLAYKLDLLAGVPYPVTLDPEVEVLEVELTIFQ